MFIGVSLFLFIILLLLLFIVRLYFSRFLIEDILDGMVWLWRFFNIKLVLFLYDVFKGDLYWVGDIELFMDSVCCFNGVFLDFFNCVVVKLFKGWWLVRFDCFISFGFEVLRVFEISCLVDEVKELIFEIGWFKDIFRLVIVLFVFVLFVFLILLNIFKFL